MKKYLIPHSGLLVSYTLHTRKGSSELVQGSVATKVDRSDLSRLAAVAAELSTYAAFKASSGSDIKELGLRTEEHRAALDRNLESVAKLSAVVQALAGACAAKAEAREVAHLTAGLERVAADVARRAGAEDVRALTTALSGVSGRAAGLEAGAREAARAAAEERRALEARLGASLAGLRSELASSAGALRQELGGGREEVEARAYVTSLEATDEALAEAEARLALCHRKTDVALRFIDWVSGWQALCMCVCVCVCVCCPVPARCTHKTPLAFLPPPLSHSFAPTPIRPLPKLPPCPPARVR